MMKYFLWDFLKKHIGITHLIAFSLGVIVICFLDALVFEKSIADWVIAVANVCMAGAAIIGLIKATNWFESKRQDAAFNYIKNLLIKHDNIKYRIDRIHFDLINISSFNKNESEKIKISDMIKEIAYDSLALERDFDLISRWNIKIKSNEVNDSFKCFIPYCNKAWEQITLFSRDEMVITAEILYGSQKDSSEELIKIKSSIETKQEILSKNIFDIFDL
ncbi:hypothetical protein [Pectobacterium aroidearum]|uniref:hypothetical protein n=1 Tax=Pectobacterium aroidearum TaxID=1201031 RepID=UPI0015E05AE3|nr:hypothetical protein [Pectobacterium aroidearum]MBA0205516.1 hypothetical protein [Pectobacterium aroidearum]